MVATVHCDRYYKVISVEGTSLENNFRNSFSYCVSYNVFQGKQTYWKYSEAGVNFTKSIEVSTTEVLRS